MNVGKGFAGGIVAPGQAVEVRQGDGDQLSRCISTSQNGICYVHRKSNVSPHQ
jgi:hypothetical protein